MYTGIFAFYEKSLFEKMTFKEIKQKLSKKTVGIAGAGGLGSNCAVALARCGIGKLIICDFDILSLDNLNRQYYFYDQVGKKKVDMIEENIRRINPDVEIITHDKKLEARDIKNIFGNCDVIVEAFDGKETKMMIAETVMEQMPQIPLVMGSGMVGWGMNDNIKMIKTGNLYICGDQTTEIAPDTPPIAPRVGIVSNMQANTVLEILLSE